MPRNDDILAKKIIENPSEFLPKAAMEHIAKAQEEMAKALDEIAKFADQEYIEKNQAEFKKMYKALYPALSSSIDFNKTVMDNTYNALKNYEAAKTQPIIELESKLYNDADITEQEVLTIRNQILGKIKDMMAGGREIGVAGSRVAFPAAVAAGAAAVAAAVEVVTLVRSVTSSSYVDRLIRTEKLNPALMELQHGKVINAMKKINVMRDRTIR